MRRRISGDSGFTLIELMVTLAVAAILLTAAAPSFADFIDKARLKGAADDVVSFIADARTESVKRNRDISVAFAGTVTAWCVGANGAAEPGTVGDAVGTAAPCDCRTAGSCAVGGQEKVLSNSTYRNVAIDAVPGSFVFDSRLGAVSTLASTAVTIKSPQDKYRLTLTVSPLGQASLCVPSGQRAVSGYPSC